MEIDRVEIEQTQFEQARIQSFESGNIDPYPKFACTLSFAQYINKYNDIEIGSRHRDIRECLAGRIVEKRTAGKKLVFYTVASNGKMLQYLADVSEYEHPESFKHDNDMIHRGDIVGAFGFVGKSLKGELSIYPLLLTILSPCLQKHIPKQIYGVNDIETRIKNRHLDMISNPKVLNTFRCRSKIISHIRKYLDEKDFVEVETPVLGDKIGGAAAKPFVTYHNDLKQNMFMRIAPELYLKQLVIGGLDRVYEIGKQFRNEAIDNTHVPEFTSIEWYMAYSDYSVMMKMVEELLSQLVVGVSETAPLLNFSDKNGEKKLDFTSPFRRIHIINELQNQTGRSFDFEAYDNLEFTQFLEDLLNEHKIECSPPRTNVRMLDKLIGHFIEPMCVNPTFLTHHPMIMSPLAKHSNDDHRLSERFELFVNGMEIANAYTELNNPKIQEQTFLNQQTDKGSGDDEIPLPDNSFVNALKYGLPPTGGCGIGIDRLVMLLTNNSTIREVIPFPMSYSHSEKSESIESKEENVKII